MTASLYQSLSGMIRGCGKGTRQLDVEDVGHTILRIKAHVVPFPAPEISFTGQKVGDFHRRVRGDPPVDQRQLDEAVLHVRGTEVDDDENQIASVRRSLAIRDEITVVGAMECEAGVVLQ